MKKIAKNRFGEYESNDLWYRRLPVISHYYFGKIKKILCSWIKIKEGIALDFGCGSQRLKKFLPPGIKYIGYDIIPEYTDIDDYKKTNPDIFFAISTFEHLLDEEIEEVLKWIASSNIQQILISIPINNLYLIWTLFGLKEKIIREHHLNIRPYSLENMHAKITKYLNLKKQLRYYNHMLSEWEKK